MALADAKIAFGMQIPNKKLSQRKFREQVVNGLLEGYSKRPMIVKRRLELPLSSRLTGKHFMSQFADKIHNPDCIVCSIRSSD